MERPFLFIINPKSGVYAGRSVQALIGFIEEKMQELGKVAQVVVTEEKGHASEITRSALRSENWAAIVAVGGDGTMNEVARCLLHQPIPLGILPLGSGNGLARHLHIPMNIAAALTRLVEGTEVLMDSALLNDIPYFCVAGMGFDAQVSHLFGNLTERGLKNYIRISLNAYRQYKPQVYVINNREIEAFLVSFANAGQFGNNAWIAPKASVTDGYLDMCLIKPFPEWYSMVLGARLFAKNLTASEYASFLQTKEITVRTTSPPMLHYDGEPLMLDTTEISFRVVPKSLRVIC